MSTVDVLARLIGDTLRSDESAGCGGYIWEYLNILYPLTECRGQVVAND